MTKKTDLNTGRYFSPLFVLFGVVLIGVIGWLLYTGETILPVVLIPVSAILLTTRKGIEIDLTDHLLNEYVQILGWKKPNKKNLGTIEGLFITKIKVSQTMNSHGGRRATVTDDVYRSYLITDEEQTLLLENSDKQKLINKLLPVSNFLGVEIVDQCGE